MIRLVQAVGEARQIEPPIEPASVRIHARIRESHVTNKRARRDSNPQPSDP
jgi:hypothetical protein